MMVPHVVRSPRNRSGDVARGRPPSSGLDMMVIGALVVSALTIMLGAFGWGWANGTASETAQERFDRDFERIVAGFGRRPPSD